MMSVVILFFKKADGFGALRYFFIGIFALTLTACLNGKLKQSRGACLIREVDTVPTDKNVFIQVLDLETNKPLEVAFLKINNYAKTIQTDTAGRASFNFLEKKVKIRVLWVGYQSQTILIKPKSDKTIKITVYLTETEELLY